jgi:hypothetical protein
MRELNTQRKKEMSDLRKFLERNRTVCDRLDRMIFSGSLLGQAADEHVKTGKSIKSVKKKCGTFFESVIPFRRWLDMQNKETWSEEVTTLYEEINE